MVVPYICVIFSSHSLRSLMDFHAERGNHKITSDLLVEARCISKVGYNQALILHLNIVKNLADMSIAKKNWKIWETKLIFKN